MRKTAALCGVLLLAVLLLFGCTKTDAEKLCGTWKTTINFSEELKSQLGDDSEYFEIDSFGLDMSFTFREDGTYLFSLVDGAENSCREALKSPLSLGIVKMFEPVAASLSVSVEEYLAELGLSVDDVVEEMMDSLDVAGFAEAVETEGYYFLSDGRLYISSSKEASFDPSVYYTFSYEGDRKFVLSGIVGESGGLLDFPAAFERVK